MTTIMIVDDDAHIREVLRYALEREGFQTVEAGDGQAALALFDAAAPDVALLDILMPELDGTELVAAIRKWEAAEGRTRMPVYAITADAFREQHDAYLAAGMDGVISKPFKAEEIEATLARISEHLERPADTKNASAA